VGLSAPHSSFRPGGVGTLLLLLLLPAFLGLGLWQLQRADSKATQFAAFRAKASSPALIGWPEDDPPRYSHVQLAGRFLPDQQFLLDNMTHEGRNGYHVLTPFVLSHEPRWLLVNRGWIPADADRAELPDVGVAGHHRTVAGQLDLLPRPGLDLGPAPTGGAWPQVVFFPDMAELAARLEQPLLGYQLLLDADQAGGFVRQWGPRSMAPEKHLGYAVQWFGFAVTLVVMYVVLGMRRARS
jgi:surfeit locus 1 family protein